MGLRKLTIVITLVIVIGTVPAIVYRAITFVTRPPYIQIVHQLPNTARLLHHERIWHGPDHCDLFEFSCSDTALRENLVSKWRLHDLTKSKEPPLSFAEYERPAWWLPDKPSANRKFGRRDDASESYVSIWEHSNTGRLFVEVGRW